MSVSDAYHYRSVSPQLGTAGVISAEQLAELGSEGYDAVINLLPIDSQYAVPGEADIVTGQGIDYIYIPVDFAAPTADDFAQFAAAMEANGDRKLMVHCAANFRVSAFYGIYGVRHLGWSVEQAYAFIAVIFDLEKKPVWKRFVADMLD